MEKMNTTLYQYLYVLDSVLGSLLMSYHFLFSIDILFLFSVDADAWGLGECMLALTLSN